MGLLFLLSGIFIVIDTYRFISRSVPTTGTVIRCDPGENPGDCFALIRYHTKNEETIELLSTQIFDGSLHFGSYSVGEKIPINYDPAHPEDARVVNRNVYTLPGIFVTIGVILLSIEIIWWRPYVRKSARAREKNVERSQGIRRSAQQYEERGLQEQKEKRVGKQKKRNRDARRARG